MLERCVVPRFSDEYPGLVSDKSLVVVVFGAALVFLGGLGYWIAARDGLNMRLPRATLALVFAVYLTQCAKLEKISWLYIPALLIAAGSVISVARYRRQVIRRNARSEDDPMS